MYQRHLFVGSALSIALLGVSPGISAEPKDAESLESGPSARLLRREANGEQVNRRDLCNSNQSTELDENLAWQAGLIRINDKWTPVEALDSSHLDCEEYFAKRAELTGKPNAHLKLARWCQRRQLHDLTRAHYGAILCVAPNHAEARRYFRHVKVGETWYAQEDVLAAQERARNVVEDLEDWMPKLRPMIKKIQSTSTAHSVQGLDEFKAISDTAAIPALELFACDAADVIAKLCVNQIARFHSLEACEALTRIAVSREVSDAREAAIVALSKYPEQSYVPGLLNCLASEVVVQGKWVACPDGNLALSMLVGKELRDKKLVKKVTNVINVSSTFSSTARARIGQNTSMKDSKFYSNFRDIPLTALPDNAVKFNSAAKTSLGAQSLTSEGAVSSASQIYVPRETATAAAFNLREQGRMQKRMAESYNRDQRQFTERVCSLLRRLTSEDIPNDPTAWWAWWSDRNERLETSKPVQSLSYNNRSQIAVHSHTATYGQADLDVSVTGQMYQWSCLVPGTLIQTAGGLVPIERIQIGDRVVSQDVESGEIALKPVVMTTVRPPNTTVKIVTDEDTINATGGHIWWVSGKGWMRANELESGMLLHTASGTSRINVVAKNKQKVRTHNLVVDGFNTYFVGQGRMLSYDNTEVRPTMKKVPGFTHQP